MLIFDDIHTEPRLYLGGDRKAYFAILGRSESAPNYIRASYHRTNDLEQALRRKIRLGEVYLSQNRFWQMRRTVDTLKSIGLSYVDLDTHKTNFAALSPEQQAVALRIFCEDEGIPRPSIIIFSGRGLHAKWLLEKPIPAAVLRRWKEIERVLTEKLRPFGADGSAMDASRCLRAVGSKNPRSGEFARVVWVNEANTGILRYEFEDLAREVLPRNRENFQKKKTEKTDEQKRRVAEVTAGRPNFLPTRRQTAFTRIRDLRRLIQMRHGEEVPEGARNKFLIAMSCSAAEMLEPGNPEELRKIVEGYAEEITPSLPASARRSCTSTVLRRYEQGEPYHPGARWFVEMLEISPQEQAEMETLASLEIKIKKKREREKLARRKNTDRASWEANAKADRERAVSLQASGLRRKEIAAKMGKTIRQVDNLLEYARKLEKTKGI